MRANEVGKIKKFHEVYLFIVLVIVAVEAEKKAITQTFNSTHGRAPIRY